MGCGRTTATGEQTYGCSLYRRDTDRPARSFEQYCDLSRQFDPKPSPAVLPDGTAVPAYKGPGVDTFVAEFGRLDLLDYSTREIEVFVFVKLTVVRT